MPKPKKKSPLGSRRIKNEEYEEYKVVEADSKTNLELMINQLAKEEGWKVVTGGLGYTLSRYVAILRRLKRNVEGKR